MSYFTSRDLAAISLSSAIWAIINWLVSPIFWQLTHLPILCDMLGTSSLIVTAWWVRKPGATAFVGIVATVLNFILRPGANQFLGFTVASIFFDLVLSIISYPKAVEGSIKSNIFLIVISGMTTFIAGVIIGNMFLNPNVLANLFGSVIVFAIIHGVGGLAGSFIGVILIRGLESRGINSG
jgi:hypothetical protein